MLIRHRLLALDNPVLVLDEMTGQLGALSEHDLQTASDLARRGRTTL